MTDHGLTRKNFITFIAMGNVTIMSITIMSMFASDKRKLLEALTNTFECQMCSGPNGNSFEAQKRQTLTLSALALNILKYRKNKPVFTSNVRETETAGLQQQCSEKFTVTLDECVEIKDAGTRDRDEVN